MNEIFILIVIVVFAVLIHFMRKSIRAAKNEPTQKPAAKVSNEELIANANRLLALTELMKQAKEHGDTDTYQACLANKYNGELPIQKPDGTWTNLYKHTMSFSIAGINFRDGIREKLGDLNILLVPEPENIHDQNAIKVVSTDGTHIGYVPAAMTDEVRTFTSASFPYPGTATITKETDDDDDTRTFFVGEVTISKEIFMGSKIK